MNEHRLCRLPMSPLQNGGEPRMSAASNYASSRGSSEAPSSLFSLEVGEPVSIGQQVLEGESLVSIHRLFNPSFNGVPFDEQPRCKSRDQNRMKDDTTTMGNENRRLQSPFTPKPMAVRARQSRLSGSKTVATVEKRNARERNRVHTVNEAFHILKSKCPPLKAQTKRVSKLRILKTAINYICTLNRQVEGRVGRQDSFKADSPISSSGSSSISAASPPLNPATSLNATSQSLITSNLDAIANIHLNELRVTTGNNSSQPVHQQQQANIFGGLQSCMNYQEIASYVYGANFNQ